MFFRDRVGELFESSLKKTGLSIKDKTDDGLYIVNVNGLDLSISLENIRRDFKRDKDPEAVRRFIENILRTNQMIPDLEEVRKAIRFSAESSDYNLAGFFAESVTKFVSKVIVFTQEEESLINWVNDSHLEHWGISETLLYEIAGSNMNKLLDNTEIQVSSVKDMSLAMFSTEYTAFKSSLIFSSGLKDKLSPLIGWPILTVIPARDFIFAFSEKDSDLISLLGETVVREYSESSYPLTKEVIRISDEGITALGSF